MNVAYSEPSMISFGVPNTDNIISEEEEEAPERVYLSTIYPTKCILSCNGRNHDISNLISKEHPHRQSSVALPKKGNNSAASDAHIRPTTLTTSATWSLGCSNNRRRTTKSLYPNKRAIEDSTSLCHGGRCSTDDDDDEAPPVLRQWMSDSDYRYPNSTGISSIPTTITVSNTTTRTSLHQQQHQQDERSIGSSDPNPALEEEEEEDEEDFSMSFLYQLQKEQEQQRQAQQLVLQEEEKEQRRRQRQEEQASQEFLERESDNENDDEDEEEHPLLEIAPGMKVPYIGTAERTRALIRYTVKEQRTTTQTVCFSCQACLVCMTGVQYVACIVCHTVSPLATTNNDSTSSGIKPRGAGIGLLVEEAELIKQQESRRSKEMMY